MVVISYGGEQDSRPRLRPARMRIARFLDMRQARRLPIGDNSGGERSTFST